MNQTHVHLLITHLPIFGSVFGSLVLAYGIWTKTYQTLVAAYYILIISSIGAGIAYLTGEAAEETVENITGVATSLIERHEESAATALVSSLLLGVTSLVGSYLTTKKSQKTNPVAFVILFIAMVNFGITARTGYLGGQIRHTEIAAESVTQDETHEVSNDE